MDPPNERMRENTTNVPRLLGCAPTSSCKRHNRRWTPDARPSTLVPMRVLATLLSLALSVCLVAEHVRAEVQNVPVDRLVASLLKQVQERPRDLEVRVNLARVYAMAYAQKVDQILVGGKDSSQWTPRFTADFDVAYQQFDVKEPANAKVRAAAQVHLTRAIATYRSRCSRTPLTRWRSSAWDGLWFRRGRRRKRSRS